MTFVKREGEGLSLVDVTLQYSGKSLVFFRSHSEYFLGDTFNSCYCLEIGFFSLSKLFLSLKIGFFLIIVKMGGGGLDKNLMLFITS